MTLDIFLLFITLEYYQMGRSMIENGWCIQKIWTKYFVFVASCLSLNVLANFVMKELEIRKILVLKLETMKQLESMLEEFEYKILISQFTL